MSAANIQTGNTFILRQLMRHMKNVNCFVSSANEYFCDKTKGEKNPPEGSIDPEQKNKTKIL